MMVATSATARNLTSLSGEAVASTVMWRPLLADLRAPSRIWRTSHVRLQSKSCTEKGNPGGRTHIRQICPLTGSSHTSHHGSRSIPVQLRAPANAAQERSPNAMAVLAGERRAAMRAASPVSGSLISLAAAEFAAAVPRGLDRGQDRGPHPVPLQFPDR